MKNSLFVIAGLLIVIWCILFWGLNSIGMVHLLPVIAGFIILVRIIFNEKLSKKW